jgi:Xaa-Pro dipeptidase
MPSRREEVRIKHQRVLEYLRSHDLDAVVLTQRGNFAWYTAGGLNHVSTADTAGVSSLLVTAGKAICITNNIEAPRMVEEELADLGIEVRAGAWHDEADLSRVWSTEIGRLRAACDVPLASLPAQVSRLGGDFATLRWVMTEGEIQRYRALAREVAECLESACRQARPGMSEQELGGRITACLFDRGVRAPVVLVAADDRVRRYRHPLPTTRRLERYGMGVVGGERHGLFVSTTRLFSFGPIDADLRRRHEAVCQVDSAMIAATRPDRTLGDVMEIAQLTYAATGFPDEWTEHHQGGSTGYAARELKALPKSMSPIRVNQVFAWNPSIAGTKSEDTLLVGPEGNVILSTTGQWPTTSYEADGQTWLRPDILSL